MSEPTVLAGGTWANRWLHRFASLVAACTLALIAMGGLVTSKGVGMAVPDWPTTYGYNMFFFPIHLWEGGVFHEHVHRLMASAVGFLTIILACWTQLIERRLWLKNLAWGALTLVVVQGVLGGKRVLLNDVTVWGLPGSVFFGVLHAATAQLFLCLIGFIAWATSSTWERTDRERPAPVWASRMVPGLTGLILVQLLVAATMRHQHSGLAIPDFPKAYGQWYPATDAASLVSINQHRTQIVDDSPVTAGQIHLQMLHRFVAVLLLGGVWSVSIPWFKQRGVGRRFAIGWSLLLLGQFVLGAATIWTNKAADLATAHVVVGAASLLTGALFSVTLWRQRVVRSEDNSCRRPVPFLNDSPVVAGTSVPIFRSAN